MYYSNQKEFLSLLGIAGSVPSTVVIVGHAFIGTWVSVHTKSVYSQVGIIVTFVGVIVLAILDTEDWTDVFMALNLALAVIINAFRGLFRATIGYEFLARRTCLLKVAVTLLLLVLSVRTWASFPSTTSPTSRAASASAGSSPSSSTSSSSAPASTCRQEATSH